MNKKIIMLLSVVTALFLVFTLWGCEKKAVGDDGKIKVVATAFPHYDFVRQIAGEKAELTMLIKPGSEVHTYDPSPSDIAIRAEKAICGQKVFSKVRPTGI